ncbi:hypothetical protein TBLA_0I00170 [Henningerozyma blattae CBS 6284]|uniref:Uncharacterized protein n=1 Tax=Henningerozyma blattae (strain ATCC 34711 / CBS 6284 / DSM 70876 / NBRC 10599 / NRRL Y-10934 / UCD 77-7) TaxID=1071380 RepID=I2H8I0_HENB6|nr:hypothetical protein TBLA_0I00170 [Tetrapisispora blattae CBS 6284]CCH62682.1 hypothetical protein TBLA_0I00170 [Tetrapisispora blattae CBS 6284]
MGNICACLVNSDSNEDESLLAGQQNSYGTDNVVDEETLLGRQMKEQEEQIMLRNQELRDIVNSTNDKLIDISMISNSGIVLEGHDNNFKKFLKEIK